MPSSVIVISGASRGLGLSLVEHFLAGGNCVAAFSRSASERIEGLLSDPVSGGRLLFAALDVADATAVQRFVDSTAERFGRIDALVNNAGVADDGVLAMMPEASIDRMLQTNIRGALLLSKECIRHMLLGNGGAIISIASVVAERGFSGLAAYSATKAALLGMTRALARELGERNIRVNAISPGFVETEMSAKLSPEQRAQIVRRTPLGRLAQPADIAAAVEFLLSPAAAFITGQNLCVDGGASI